MSNIIPFHRRDGDDWNFERRRRPRLDEKREPEIPKWMRSLPTWKIDLLFAIADITSVFRYEPAPIPDEPSEEDELLVEKFGPNLWYVARKSNRPKHDPEKTEFCTCGNPKRRKSRVRSVCPACGMPKSPSESPRVIVEYLPDEGKWTCNCVNWRKQKWKDDSHIKRVKKKEKIGGGYSTAPRRPQTRYVYKRGALGDDQRMVNARATLPSRIPKLFATLCKGIVPDKERNPNGGPTGFNDSVISLGGAFRSLFGVAYLKVKAVMEKDGTMLSLQRQRRPAPSERTFSGATASPRFAAYARAMIAFVAYAFVRMEAILVGDSFGNPNTGTQNALDSKESNQKRLGGLAHRTKRPMPKTHFAAGAFSHAIFAAQASPGDGKGSGDPSHFIPLILQTYAIKPDWMFTAWDQAYRVKELFKLCEQLGIEFRCPEKTNQDSLAPDSDWGEMAARGARLQRYDEDAYQEEYRMRSTGESPQSSIKIAKDHIRSRQRKYDPAVDLDEMLKELGCEDDEPITKMAREKLEALHEAAEANVGWARLFEMLMDVVVHNLVCFVRWEHRFGIWGSLGTGFQFPPLLVVKETDIPDEANASAFLRNIELRYGHLRNNEFPDEQPGNYD